MSSRNFTICLLSSTLLENVRGAAVSSRWRSLALSPSEVRKAMFFSKFPLSQERKKYSAPDQVFDGAGDGAGVTGYDAGNDFAAGTFSLQKLCEPFLISSVFTKHPGLTQACLPHIDSQEIQILQQRFILCELITIYGGIAKTPREEGTAEMEDEERQKKLEAGKAKLSAPVNTRPALTAGWLAGGWLA
ncbi:hypothetical protein EYF80_042399 [Liparis tanakae]|uniref:Uncharacterized protein n=1 Tax=Liparis tanakae TaxID=230148 RepID=A0A4Z2G1G7_9TELE|nr:hypothetical protein EYF80_042399 [Liparis tanakae]